MALNKKQKKQSIAAIACLTAVAAAIFLSSTSKSTAVPYSDFVDKIESNTVQSVTIKDNEIEFSVFGDRNSYTTRYLSDSELLDKLDSTEIKYTVLPDKNTPDWPMVVYIMSGLLMTGIITSVVTSSGGGKEDYSTSVSSDNSPKNKKRIIVDKKPKISFADIGGNIEAKESLKEIIDFLEHPNEYTKMGAKLPKGTLLIGPPGTGKTLMAKAVAGEANVPFIYMAGSDFVEMYVGLGAAKVRRVFEIAEKNAPCIIFIDEIDAIGKKRDPLAVGSGSDEREQTLNQLLSEMDGFNSSKGVVVLAATNRPEVLDEAITRPGRFDRRIIVERPDAESRKQILKSYLSKIKTEENIDINPLIYETAGYTGADLANIVNEAAIKAVRNKKEAVGNDELQEAMEEMLSGSKNHSVALTEIEKCIIATHEASHTIASIALDTEGAVNKVSIIPRSNTSLGYTINTKGAERHVAFKDEMLNQIRILLAGYCGEFVLLDNVSSAAYDDIQEATYLIREMVMKYGMSTEFGPTALNCSYNDLSDNMKFCIDRKVIEIIKHCYTETIDFIQSNSDILQDLATALVKKETLTNIEIKEILKGKTIKVPKFDNFKESPTLANSLSVPRVEQPKNNVETFVSERSQSREKPIQSKGQKNSSTIETSKKELEEKKQNNSSDIKEIKAKTEQQKQEQEQNVSAAKEKEQPVNNNKKEEDPKAVLTETIEIDDSDFESMSIEMNIPDEGLGNDFEIPVEMNLGDDTAVESSDDLPDAPPKKEDKRKSQPVISSQKERDSKILNDILNMGNKKNKSKNNKKKNESTEKSQNNINNNSKELTEDDY